MQVRMLQDAIGPTGTLLRGTTYDLADELARTLKGCGRADYVTAPSQSATPVGDLSSVSQAGNQASATLATTTGTPGQIVKLSDGPDAGALLVWAIPQGSTSYTWCWWLWPQAAY